MEKEITILTVEDNPADMVLLHRGLSKIENVKINLININNGEDAINFILKKEAYVNSPTVDMVILDINLPKKDGYEVLDAVKNDITYRYIPIIIYTTSNEPRDINKSYYKQANSYITKSFDVQKLFNKINDLINYWIFTSKIPDKRNLLFVKGKKTV